LGFKTWEAFQPKEGKIKEDMIRLGLNKWEFAIFGFAETNLDWRTLKEEEKLPFSTQGWWEAQHISRTHNRTRPPKSWRQCSFLY